MPTRSVLVACGALLMGLSACSKDASSAPTRDHIPLEAQEAFPSENGQDWATYGDDLAIVRVEDEHVDELAPDAKDRGEGVQNRSITLAIEGRPLWTRPESPAIPDRLSVITAGYIVSKGEQVPYLLPGEPRLEVGQTYMALLTYFGSEWTYVTGTPVLIKDGKLAYDKVQQSEWPFQAGLSDPNSVADTVAKIGPDPAAAAYGRLDPAERYSQVVQDKAAVSTTTAKAG